MGFKDAIGHALLDNDALHYSSDVQLTPEEQWLLTLSAPLSAFNGDYVNAVPTGKDDDSLREGIASVWGVHDRATFEQTARRLADTGQRSAYLSSWKAIGAIDNAVQTTPALLRMAVDAFFPAFYQIKARKSLDYRALGSENGHSVPEMTQLMTGSQSWVQDLKKHFQISPSDISSLVAWDAVRLVSLTRWAVQLGYIDRPEFTHFAGALTQEVRAAYNGWPQVSAAYIAAGMIWQPSKAREEHLLRTNRLLLSDARSPYRSVPFR